MNEHNPQFVPKVHPASRAVLPEDPMSIHATAVPGDPELMLRAVVQEFGGMGWDFDQILSLFHDPFYPVLQGLGQALGDAEIRRRIAAILEQYGVYRFQCNIQEAPEEPEVVPIAGLMGVLDPRRAEPEVVQITGMARAPRSRRENHDAPGV